MRAVPPARTTQVQIPSDSKKGGLDVVSIPPSSCPRVSVLVEAKLNVGEGSPPMSVTWLLSSDDGLATSRASDEAAWDVRLND